MHGKLAAAATIALFLISTFLVVKPVQATFTLGDLTATYPYHANDFDPHVSGVIGYVWPGGGQNAYSGFPNIASPTLSPGYQTPYPRGKPPGAPSSSWYQLQGDTYSPFGAVLTGSTGDLIFAINATAGYQTDGFGPYGPTGIYGASLGWVGLSIAIPPGFIVPDSSQVVSSFTNDYAGIYVSKVGPYDRYIPGWTVITVLTDTGNDFHAASSYFNRVYYNRQTIQFTAAKEWYYVRVNGVTAPSAAGKYFFKMLLFGGSGYLDGLEGTGTGVCTTSSGSGLNTAKGSSCFPIPGHAVGITAINAGSIPSPTQFLPTENWPVMLVKGEIDPAIITGTIRYAGYNQSLYSQPVKEAGHVYAKMMTRLDPYTGQARPDLPKVDAMAYFNATAQGHYEVEGVAPGVYDLYASAAGYPQTLIASAITVLRGQSLHFDGYLQPGPVIHGNVFTKHQFGDEPWPTATDTATPNQYVKIELYNGPTLNHRPDSKANMVSWSPLPCVAGGQQEFFGWADAGVCGDPRLGGQVAFPWHEYVPSRGYFSGISSTAFNFYQVSTGADDGSQRNKLTQDPQGVGPPQHWFVQGGTTIPFHIEFGVKGEYGAPRDLDGMVPQVYATWVNGLTPGRYYARAWVFRYVQSALDGSTFQEYYFDITPNEWAGDVTLPIDLRLSSWVNKTVHFHNIVDGITENPIDTGAGMIAGTLVDGNGQVWSYNQTWLGYMGYYPSGADGRRLFRTNSIFNSNGGGVFPPFDLDKAKLNQFAIETGRANIQFWGINDTWGGENYGIPSGTYTPHVYVLGYLEQTPTEQVSVTLSGNPTIISDHMFRGAGFNITVYSIDWQRPRVNRPWVWGNPAGTDSESQVVGQEIDVGFYKNGTLVDFLGDSPSALADTLATSCLYQGGDPTALVYGLPPWSYACGNITPSSVQASGGGWDPQALLANGTYVNYQNNANDAFFGQEIRIAGLVGGYTLGTILFETATLLFAPFTHSIYLFPTAMDEGLYGLRGFTYGYVQETGVSVYVQRCQVADAQINLVIGVNVTLLCRITVYFVSGF